MFRRCCHLVTYGLAYLFTCHTLSSCIDEDLSGCGKNYRIQYQLEVEAELDAELDQELDEPNETAIRQKLKEAFRPVFAYREHGADLDLNFFADNRLTHHEVHNVNTSHSEFSIYLKPDNYEHLALANVQQEPLLEKMGADAYESLTVGYTPQSMQAKADTLPSQTRALFVARKTMRVADTSATYLVRLTMQNSCVALVVDNRGYHAEQMTAFASGFATEFAPADSTFRFARPFVMRTNATSAGNHQAFYVTTFPSRNVSEMVALRPNAADAPETAYWKMEVLVKMNGKYTRSVLSVNEPLQAGEMRVVKAYLREDGSISTSDTQVGVSVELDWKPGGDHDIEI